MADGVDQRTRRLDEAGAAVAAAAGGLARLPVEAAWFGADAAGWVGEVGRALHAQWTAALCDREREARAVAEGLSDLSWALRRVAQAYADADDTAARRVTRSGP